MGKKKYAKGKPVEMSLAEFQKTTKSDLTVPTTEQLTKGHTWGQVSIPSDPNSKVVKAVLKDTTPLQ